MKKQMKQVEKPEQPKVQSYSKAEEHNPINAIKENALQPVSSLSLPKTPVVPQVETPRFQLKEQRKSKPLPQTFSDMLEEVPKRKSGNVIKPRDKKVDKKIQPQPEHR